LVVADKYPAPNIRRRAPADTRRQLAHVFGPGELNSKALGAHPLTKAKDIGERSQGRKNYDAERGKYR